MRKQTTLLLAALITLAGCSEFAQRFAGPGEPEALQPGDVFQASSEALEIIPDAQVLAICGPSKGYSFFVEPSPEGWTTDPIPEGRIVLLRHPDGHLDLAFRDIGSRMRSARAWQGDIQVAFEAPDRNEYGFSIHYERTGVLETYQFLSGRGDDGLVLWTSNKPTPTATQPITKAGSFIAKCAVFR
jgi:hypothetical protein